jgi:hypothetical protein
VTEETVPAPEIRRFAAASGQAKLHSTVALNLDVAPPEQTAAWFKIFSEGELALEKGKLVYRPAAAKLEELVLYSVLANRATARRVLRLSVKT